MANRPPNAGHIAPGIIVAQHHMTGDSHGKDLQNVGGGGVDKHSYKLQAHHDAQQVVQHVAYIGEILRAGGEHTKNLNTQSAQQSDDGDNGDETLNDVQDPTEKMLRMAIPFFQLFDSLLGFRVQIFCWNFVMAQNNPSDTFLLFYWKNREKKRKNFPRQKVYVISTKSVLLFRQDAKFDHFRNFRISFRAICTSSFSSRADIRRTPLRKEESCTRLSEEATLTA